VFCGGEEDIGALKPVGGGWGEGAGDKWANGKYREVRGAGGKYQVPKIEEAMKPQIRSLDMQIKEGREPGGFLVYFVSAHNPQSFPMSGRVYAQNLFVP